MCCLQDTAFQGAAPVPMMAKDEAGRGCSLDLCPPPTPNGQMKARKQFGDHPPHPRLGGRGVCGTRSFPVLGGW